MIVIASLWVTSCEPEKIDFPLSGELISNYRDNADADSLVFPPSAYPYGESYTNWTVRWMKQFLTYDCSQNPFLNQQNSLFHKDGPVWFLAGLQKEGESVNVKVPCGKAILFPLANHLNVLSPCPDQDFASVFGKRLENTLQEGTLDALSGVRQLSVEIDGLPVRNPSAYYFASRLFTFTGNPELAICFNPCITGSPQHAVTSGFYMMLRPLPKGKHTLHYHAEVPELNVIQDGTYYIEVTDWDTKVVKNYQ